MADMVAAMVRLMRTRRPTSVLCCVRGRGPDARIRNDEGETTPASRPDQIQEVRMQEYRRPETRTRRRPKQKLRSEPNLDSRLVALGF
jgi:hypothetical protein